MEGWINSIELQQLRSQWFLSCELSNPSFGWDVKPRSWLSVVIKNPRMSFRKRVGVLPRHPGQICPLASDHHVLLIIPIHWLASSLCLLSTSKLVCGGRSGAIWLPSHHPGGCCTLVVVEEIPPLYVKPPWVPRKRYINVTNESLSVSWLHVFLFLPHASYLLFYFCSGVFGFENPFVYSSLI